MTRGSKSSSSSSSSMDQSSSKAPITQLSSDIFDGFLTPGLTNQEKLNLIRANYDLVKQIKSLDFSNTDINNEDLARIFIKINNLEEELATSSSIGTSPKKQINTINLENCRSIKPGFLKNFNSPYLKKLNLTWVELTKEDFLTIRNNFPNLETISCSVDNITELWQNQKGEELDEIKDLMCYFLAKLEEVYFSIFSSNSKIRVLMDDGLVFNKLKTIEVTTSLSGSGLNKLLNSTSGNIETLRLSTIMASSDLSNLNLEDEKLKIGRAHV